MRPLLEILEDERMLMLKLDTIHQNMMRYPYDDVYELLSAKRGMVKRELGSIHNEIRTYISNLFEDGNVE